MPGQLYPLFLSLEGFSVLIIGFGSVGRRKLAMLIPAAPASVTIIDPRGPDGEGGELIRAPEKLVSACGFSQDLLLTICLRMFNLCIPAQAITL